MILFKTDQTLQPPQVGSANMESAQETAWMRSRGRDHVLAHPGREPGDQDGHNELSHGGTKRDGTLGKRKIIKRKHGGRDGVNRRIAIRWPQNWSSGSIQVQRWLKSCLQAPQHRTNGGLQYRAMGNRTDTQEVSEGNGHPADTPSEDSSCLQRLTSSHLMNCAPGTRARAASRQVH